MKKEETITEAKINNLDELSKVLSIKEQILEQVLVAMQTFCIGKIVRSLKSEKAQDFTLSSLFITLVVVRLWGKWFLCRL